MLEEGEMAPDFKLAGSDGREHSLSEYRGKTIVLYFYPKDDTPGCTIEARDFSKYNDEIRRLGGVVLGVSKDDFKSHCDFRDKYGLRVLLLSDPESKVIKQYEAHGNKGIFGKGTIRTTFIIDRRGKITKIYRRVQALGHAEEVLHYIKGARY